MVPGLLLREFSKGPLTASEAAAAALQGENPTAPKFETYRKCVSELKAKSFFTPQPIPSLCQP